MARFLKNPPSAKKVAFPTHIDGIWNETDYPSVRQVKASENHSIWRTRNWLYTDRKPCQIKYIPMESSNPHFVLFDSTGAPRATLRFKFSNKRFEIKSIQTERTQYVPDEINPNLNKWSKPLEKEATHKLKKSLGVYPTELLLFEFLKFYAPKIRKESDVCLFVSPVVPLNQKVYGPLLDRFFKKAPALGEGQYVLSFAKRRVKEALNLK